MVCPLFNNDAHYNKEVASTQHKKTALADGFKSLKIWMKFM
jgi:hypothetical protein